MSFTLRCDGCGDMNPVKWEEVGSIEISFHRESQNIMDRMVIVCNNCGNKEERGITWPLNILEKDAP